MAGILSKGITLSYADITGGTVGTYNTLTLLQEIPDLGGDTESVEVTTLDDAAHMYINGLISYGESVEFKFLYDKTQWTTLAALTGEKSWKVTLPDSSTCIFKGEPHVKLNAVGTNDAITYNLSVKPTSEMVFA